MRLHLHSTSPQLLLLGRNIHEQQKKSVTRDSEPTIVLTSTIASTLSVAFHSVASSRTWRRSRHTTLNARDLNLQMRRLRRFEPDDVQIRKDVAAAVVVHGVHLGLHSAAVAGISIGDDVFEDADYEAVEVEKDIADGLADFEVVGDAVESIRRGTDVVVWAVAEPVDEGTESL